MSFADSIRQTASIARCVSVVTRGNHTLWLCERKLLRGISRCICSGQLQQRFLTPLGETRVADAFGPGGEVGRWSAPVKCLDILEERRVRTQRRELLEEQRQLTLLVAQNVGGKGLDRAVFVDQLRGRCRPDPRQARVAVGAVATSAR